MVLVLLDSVSMLFILWFPTTQGPLSPYARAAEMGQVISEMLQARSPKGRT